MGDNGSSKENAPGTSSSLNSGHFGAGGGTGGGGLGRAPSSLAGNSSMYAALGTYNAEQRQKELQILAEEDLVAHLTKVKKDLQDQNEALRKKISDLKLSQQVLEAENQTSKSKKEAIQKEVQENKVKLSEMQERLGRKEKLIQRLKTARSDKKRQFALLMQRREEFYDAVFEASPKGQLHRQVKQEISKSQELLQSHQLTMRKLESALKLKIKEQNKRWVEFTKKCVKVAEYFVKMNQKEQAIAACPASGPTWKSSSTLLVGDRFSCTWNDLYQMSTPGNVKRLGSIQFTPSMAAPSGEETMRQRFTNESLMELKSSLDSTSSLGLSATRRRLSEDASMPPPPPPKKLYELKSAGSAGWTPTPSPSSTSQPIVNTCFSVPHSNSTPTTETFPTLPQETVNDTGSHAEGQTSPPNQQNPKADAVPTIVVTPPEESTPIPMDSSPTEDAHNIQGQSQIGAADAAPEKSTPLPLTSETPSAVSELLPSNTHLQVLITDTSAKSCAPAPPTNETNNSMQNGINSLFTQTGPGSQQPKPSMFDAFSNPMNVAQEKLDGDHRMQSVFGPSTPAPSSGEEMVTDPHNTAPDTTANDDDAFLRPFAVPSFLAPRASAPGQESGGGGDMFNDYFGSFDAPTSSSSGNIWSSNLNMGNLF